MYSKRLKLMISSAAVCMTVFALATHANAAAAQKPVITSTTTTKAISTLTDQGEQALAQAAGRVLYHTEKAQMAIANKNKDVALKQLNQGLTLMKIIRGALPKYKVTTKIESAQGKYTSSDIVTQRYVTVLSTSFVEDVLAPVVQGKVAMAHHQPVGQKSIEDFSRVSRTTITLDTALAGKMLQVAQADVKADKLEQANKALFRLEHRGVMITAIDVPLPLSSAIDNLYVAQDELAKNHYNAANATLKDASTDLKAYEKMTGDTRGQDVHALAYKIDTLTSAIDGQKDKKDIEKTMQNAKDDIASWWHDAKSWVSHK